MKQYKCEKCNSIIQVDSTYDYDWMHVTRYEYTGTKDGGPNFIRVNEDFCSIECLVQWLLRAPSKKNEEHKKNIKARL